MVWRFSDRYANYSYPVEKGADPVSYKPGDEVPEDSFSMAYAASGGVTCGDKARDAALRRAAVAEDHKAFAAAWAGKDEVADEEAARLDALIEEHGLQTTAGTVAGKRRALEAAGIDPDTGDAIGDFGSEGASSDS